VHVLQQLRARQDDLSVAQASVWAVLGLEQGRRRHRADLAGVDPVGDAGVLRLPGEGLDDSIDGIGLVLLDLELELHRVSFFLQGAAWLHGSSKDQCLLTWGFTPWKCPDPA
jgi:hypothetical protein